MCQTTTPPRPATQDAIRKLPPNPAAGAVIPLKSYLIKYLAKYADELVPSTPPALPSDVDPNAYKRVAFSILPLLDKVVSPYYAGVFDDDTDFSASLLKVAALFAAGELLSKAKAALPGAANSSTFFTNFNGALQTEVNNNADPQILSMTFPSTAPVALLPKTSSILNPTGFGTTSGPSVAFTNAFNSNLTTMIVDSSDPGAAFCIDRLGYGFISAALIENKFFDPNNGTGVGIWLAGDYEQSVTVKRIPCVNDHPDTELTTTRQMCRLLSMIRLNQLPQNDTDTNTLMQNLLGQAGSWLVMGQHIGGVKDLGVAPLFTKIHAKVGFAGLGTIQTPLVYSEGLIIKWNDTSQVDSFNNKIDPGNANPKSRLSGEIAVCWQNLLARVLSSGFDGIVDVLNDTISDFLDQAGL
jgi:hypothetical protein